MKRTFGRAYLIDLLECCFAVGSVNVRVGFFTRSTKIYKKKIDRLIRLKLT